MLPDLANENSGGNIWDILVLKHFFGYLKFKCVFRVLPHKLPHWLGVKGTAQRGDGKAFLGEAGKGIPLPLHGEEAF